MDWVTGIPAPSIAASWRENSAKSATFILFFCGVVRLILFFLSFRKAPEPSAGLAQTGDGSLFIES
jgi:hypothetical protein